LVSRGAQAKELIAEGILEDVPAFTPEDLAMDLDGRPQGEPLGCDPVPRLTEGWRRLGHAHHQRNRRRKSIVRWVRIQINVRRSTLILQMPLMPGRHHGSGGVANSDRTRKTVSP